MLREYRSLKSHDVQGQGTIYAIIPMTLAATETWDPEKLITDSKIKVDGKEVQVIAQELHQGLRCVLTRPVVEVRGSGWRKWGDTINITQPKDPISQQIVLERIS